MIIRIIYDYDPRCYRNNINDNSSSIIIIIG